MKLGDWLRRCIKVAPLAAVLGLSLALSACDRCGDFFWNSTGSCKNGPRPN